MSKNIVAGAHRPVQKHAGSSRVAVLAVTAGALSMGAATSNSTIAFASEAPADAQTTTDTTGAAAVPTLLPTADSQAPEETTPLAAAPQVIPAAGVYAAATNLAEALDTSFGAAEARAALDRLLRAPAVSAPTTGVFTSGFEMRWGTMHTGIDIANAIGTPIYAIADGVVIESGPASGYGNWIKIQHEDGTISLYGHMETLDVVKGDVVSSGQKIAGMGNRGFSTGSHLHFEIHPDGKTPVDPVPWFAQRGITIQ